MNAAKEAVDKSVVSELKHRRKALVRRERKL